MRAWIWTVVLVVVGVALALVLREHSGNVVVLLPPTTKVEFSLNFAIVALLLAFLLFYGVLRCLSWLINSSERFRGWRSRRAQKRDQNLLQEGWLFVLEGRPDQAEKNLSKLLGKTRQAKTKVLAAVAVARACQDQADYRRRDEALILAEESAGKDQRLQTVVTTARASLLLDQGAAAQAVQLLQPLQDANSRAYHTAQLLLRAYRKLEDYDRVYELTRLLLRRNALERSEALLLIEESAAARLYAGGPDNFKRLWNDLRTEEKTLPAVALAAAELKAATQDYEEEARILEAALQLQLHPLLLQRYAQSPREQVARRLAKAEHWLKVQPDYPELLTTLGQLCLKGELWGQAEYYLKRSLAQRQDLQVYALLGALSDSLERQNEAAQYWRQAAALVGELPIIQTKKWLPAADVTLDPQATLVDGHVESAPSYVSSTYDEPIAASAAGFEHELTTPAATPASAVTPTSHRYGTHEEYFDTAPPAGVEELSNGSQKRNS